MIDSTEEAVNNALLWLQEALRRLQSESREQNSSTVEVEQNASEPRQIAWGSKVSPVFRERVLWIADDLGCNPDHLMACMAWESGETFRADITNFAGSGATGLIQFMPKTAKGLGTSTQALAQMSAEDQLKYVYKYFLPYRNRLDNLGDIYMAILWPAAVQKPDHYVLFDRRKSPTAFRQNAGLDLNADGLVTRAECLVKVNEKLAKGLKLAA